MTQKLFRGDPNMCKAGGVVTALTDHGGIVLNTLFLED